MTGPLEAQLEAIFRRQVRAIGGLVLKLAPTERGIPDRLVLLPKGGMYLVELKRENEVPTPIQEIWHTRALARGIEVHVLAGRQEITDWVRQRADELFERDQA